MGTGRLSSHQVRSGTRTNAVADIKKRFLDVLCSTAAWIALSPFLAVLVIIIRYHLGAPVFYKQTRPGLSGKLFRLYKFRTMTDARDDQGQLLPDGDRLTSLGRFLRTTSLDELPELYNIIKGDMSIVGPRPLLRQYLTRYTPEQARRHEVKPGLTGWAQINGRNAISWEDKFNYDVWYVDHRSLKLDMAIIVKTIEKVIKREGINQAGEASMCEFMGYNNVGGDNSA